MSKVIFFDLDGTLTDSQEGILSCVELALRQLGLTVPERKKLKPFIGPPLRVTFPKFGVPEDRVEEAVALYRSRFSEVGLFEAQPYPGIHGLLSKLKARGFRLCVATSKPEGFATRVLEHFKLDRYFDIVCGATLDGQRDSKASVIAYLLEQLPAGTEAVMVGDTAHDVIGAKEFGIPTVGVTWGYDTVENLTSAGAAAIAHSMEELYQILTEELL